MSAGQDIFKAYGLSQIGLTVEDISDILNSLSSQKKTYHILQSAIFSNRDPPSIIAIANKVGMYIPNSHRVGIKAYDFFIRNINYYESVLETIYYNISYPEQEDIFLAEDKLTLLMKYPDHMIRKKTFIFYPEYSDRKIMLKQFITDNYDSIGYFTCESNLHNNYNQHANLFVYSSNKDKLAYCLVQMENAVDLNNKCMWKQMNEKFHPLTVRHLYKTLLIKQCKWKLHDGYNRENVTVFNSLINKLNILILYFDNNILSLSSIINVLPSNVYNNCLNKRQNTKQIIK